MKKNHNEIIKKVDQWLAFGVEDLHLARHGLGLKSQCPYRLIAYHAQQCVEKHLKAYLVFHQVDFPYTHNIARLLELCDQNTSTNWVEELKQAEELTPFAITTRYPGQDDEVTKREAEIAVNVADQVREVVRIALRK
jgi:HEPN domain-containing protein